MIFLPIVLISLLLLQQLLLQQPVISTILLSKEVPTYTLQFFSDPFEESKLQGLHSPWIWLLLHLLYSKSCRCQHISDNTDFFWFKVSNIIYNYHFLVSSFMDRPTECNFLIRIPLKLDF